MIYTNQITTNGKPLPEVDAEAAGSAAPSCSVSLCRDCRCCAGAIVIGEVIDGERIIFPDSQQLNRCPHCGCSDPLDS